FGLGARPDEQPPADPRRWLVEQLDRFEPRPQALAQVPQRAAVAEQLGDYLAEQRMAGRAERQLQPVAMPSNGETQPNGAQADPLKRYLRQSIREDYLVMNSARLDAALTSGSPFVERLVHFWANHFAVSVDKLPVIGLAGLLEFEAIRPNVVGRFS